MWVFILIILGTLAGWLIWKKIKYDKRKDRSYDIVSAPERSRSIRIFYWMIVIVIVIILFNLGVFDHLFD